MELITLLAFGHHHTTSIKNVQQLNERGEERKKKEKEKKIIIINCICNLNLVLIIVVAREDLILEGGINEERGRQFRFLTV